MKFRVTYICSCGAVIAAILSWVKNASILWMILHWWCGWFYVIYWALTK